MYRYSCALWLYLTAPDAIKGRESRLDIPAIANIIFVVWTRQQLPFTAPCQFASLLGFGSWLSIPDALLSDPALSCLQTFGKVR